MACKEAMVILDHDRTKAMWHLWGRKKKKKNIYFAKSKQLQYKRDKQTQRRVSEGQTPIVLDTLSNAEYKLTSNI